MAVSVTFKQQCPSCEAMVTIKENMDGKKVECHKCKDKFIAEMPVEEEEKPAAGKKKTAAAVNGKAAAGKKSARSADEDEEVVDEIDEVIDEDEVIEEDEVIDEDEVIEEEDDEPPQTKSKSKPAANGKAKKPVVEVDEDEEIEEVEDEDEPPQSKSKSKPAANGKTKKAAAKEDEDEEVEDEQNEDEDDEAEKGSKKKKKAGGSNKLTIGLILAGVGVVVLGVAAFFLLSPRKEPTGTANINKPGGPVEQKKDDAKPPPPPVETKKYEPTPTALNDAENARLTNLLPNDSEHIAHYFQRELFQPNSTLYDAVFKTPGALDDAVLRKRLGFSVLAIDDLIHAEKHSGPGAAWTFTVIHFSELIKEADLKTALKLKPAGASIEGQPYYKTSDPHPWLDTLARFSVGIPNYTRIFEPRRLEQPTYVRIHNPQTLILGDEAPVVAFLKAKAQFQQQTIRATPPPTPVVPPTPSGMMGGMTGMMGGSSPMPMPMPPPARPAVNPMGAPKAGMIPPVREQAALAFDPASGSFVTPRPEFVRFAFVGNDQAQPPGPGGGGGNQLKLADTSWKGTDDATKEPIQIDILGDTAVLLAKTPSKGKWQSTDGTNVTLTFDNGTSYQGVVNLQAGTFTGTAKNGMKNWNFSFTKIALTDSTQTPGTGSSREDMYLTIKPALKAILDRMELRSDSRDKVLFSSATDMDANVLVTNTPELKDIVLRRPRQFWDVTLLLPEQKPRIRMLGTALLQRDPLRYQLRNEITCAQELDAKTFKQEITDRASHTIRKFLKNLVKHEVVLAVSTPETKQAPVAPVPPPPPGQPPVTPDAKKPAPDVKSSQITVNQQDNTVDFVLDLVLDQPTLRQVEGIASLTAGSLRVAMEAAASFSVRHNLASAGRMLGEKGLSEREVVPGQFPPGALVRKGTTFTDREPRNRISWMAGLLPYMGQQHLYERINFEQSWRDPGNWMPGSMIVPQFLDPSYPSYARQVAVSELPLDFGATHYVGIAGVGLDAAAYKRNDPATVNKRGVFGYDESATMDEIQRGRGVSNTIVAIQVPHDGLTGVSPWIAGGGATVRGVPEKNSIAPFVLSKDKNGNTIQHQGKKGTYATMADGSVRFIDQTVSDAVFKAMCTVNGPAPEDFNLDSDPATPLVPAPKGAGDTPTKPLEKPPVRKPVDEKPADKTPTRTEPAKKAEVGQPAGDPKAALQGVWLATSVEMEGKAAPAELAKKMRFTFKGDKIYTLRKFASDKDEECAYRIDAQKLPHHLDFTPPGEPEAVQGIYEVQGDELKICVADPMSSKGRPTAFVTGPNSGSMLIVLRRQK